MEGEAALRPSRCWREGKVFFLEKKGKLLHFNLGLSEKAQPRIQKFFGSFFQKRTASFLPPIAPRLS